MKCSSQLVTRLSWFEGEVLMCWVEGVLVVVSVPASHDCCLQQVVSLSLFLSFAGRVAAPQGKSV